MNQIKSLRRFTDKTFYKTCEWCNALFEVKVCIVRLKFCSRPCYWAYKKKFAIRGEAHPEYKKKKVKCGRCGKEITLYLSRVNRVKVNYCNKECKYDRGGNKRNGHKKT